MKGNKCIKQEIKEVDTEIKKTNRKIIIGATIGGTCLLAGIAYFTTGIMNLPVNGLDSLGHSVMSGLSSLVGAFVAQMYTFSKVDDRIDLKVEKNFLLRQIKQITKENLTEKYTNIQLENRENNRKIQIEKINNKENKIDINCTKLKSGHAITL